MHAHPSTQSASRLSTLRDGVLALFWTDCAAGDRIRQRLQQHSAGAGQSPKGARRMAGLRLMGALGLASLFAPAIPLGLAAVSQSLALTAPALSRVVLGLALLLVALYGRGMLQIGRSDAWLQSLYRVGGHDLQSLPHVRTLLHTPPAVAGGEVLQHWRTARRWAWATVAVLMGLVWILAHWPPSGLPALPFALGVALLIGSWMPGRYDQWVMLAVGARLDASELMGEAP